MPTLTVPAKTDQLDTVIAFVNETLDRGNCPAEIRFRVELAVEEIFVNIASYAYFPGEGEAEISCALREDTGELELRFADWGKAFDPLARPEADTSREATLNREGGLGLFLVKKTMDRVRYVREDGRNVLTVTKGLRN